MSYAPIRSELSFADRPVLDSSTATLTKPVQAKPRPKRRRNNGLNGRRPVPSDAFPIIVHSHLCWDWVWQRPQQFISRLSRTHKVLFVELIAPDPELAEPSVRFRRLNDYPDITVLRLQFPAWRWPDGEWVDRERRRIVKDFVQSSLGSDFRNPVQWFYDPMAVTAFAGEMEEILTVYDCMDELSKFRGAPPGIIAREKELLARADVVFTGGRKLFEAKSRYHDNCHFYGCGVDVDHFGRARTASLDVPADLAALHKPVLGYFGVVDERMDYDLIAGLADAHPEWAVAMVGPVFKVDPAALPQRPNLHWLGQRAYADLPGCCKAFDVCLMPFARNESTEFINPTKALEYMATGRPIVSTAVPDVVSNFGSVVKIAQSPPEFIELCARAIERPDHEAVSRGLKMASENTWDAIVAKLEHHVMDALRHPANTKVVA